MIIEEIIIIKLINNKEIQSINNINSIFIEFILTTNHSSIIL